MLGELPTELLSQIVSYVPNAREIAHLSRTSRALNKFVQDEGWKVFTKSRFPSLEATEPWNEAAHDLTTLSRNWDRRAFVARYLEPSKRILSFPSGEISTQWRRPKGQTMGFQPVIDSYLEHPGGRSRKEVLAWSAGAELVLRKTFSGRNQELRQDWITYKPPGSLEGRDDISFVHILRRSQLSLESPSREQVLLGTVSGGLSLLDIEQSDVDGPIDPSSRLEQVRSYETGSRALRAADVSPTAATYLAACLGDAHVAVYHTRPEDNPSGNAPMTEIEVLPNARKAQRTWSTRFLSDDRLAVGVGPSTEPVQVYEFTPSGLSPYPIRKFGMPWADIGAEQGDITPRNEPKQSSVYPIVPLPTSSIAGGGNGNVFLSGSYDGQIRLVETNIHLDRTAC